MARGNRGGRRSNPAPPPLPATASPQQLDPAAALAAYEHMRRGTHAKALRILQKDMDKLGGLESSPPFLLHAYSTAHKGAADISADRKIRARHFKSAAEAARRATEVAPDSVLLAHSYAMVLLGGSRDMNDHDAMAAYQSIIAECERGIQIEEPSDPTLYHLGHPNAPDAVLSDLRDLLQLVSEDLQKMKRYNETKLKIAEFQRQASLGQSPAGHCAHQGKGDLQLSHEVRNDSGKCRGQGSSSVPEDSADGDTSEKTQTHLDSDDFGYKFSTTGAYANQQEGEIPADKTVEYGVQTNGELNLNQFAEQ